MLAQHLNKFAYALNCKVILKCSDLCACFLRSFLSHPLLLKLGTLILIFVGKLINSLTVSIRKKWIKSFSDPRVSFSVRLWDIVFPSL